jgi:tetratricopeptide (TPR) repeat protein
MQQFRNIAHLVSNREYEARAVGVMAQIAQNRGDYPRARELNEKALALFRDVQDREGEAWCSYNLGGMLRDLGQHSQALAVLEKGLRISREIQDRQDESWILGYMGDARSGLGQFDPAWSTLEKALAIAREIEDRQNEAEILLFEVRMLLDWSLPDPAIPLLEQCAQISQEVNERVLLGWCAAYQGRLADLRGGSAAVWNGRDAFSWFAEAIALAAALDTTPLRAAALTFQSEALARRQRREEALGCARPALALREGMGQVRHTAALHALLLPLLASGDDPNGDRAEARQHAAALQALLHDAAADHFEGIPDPAGALLACARFLGLETATGADELPEAMGLPEAMELPEAEETSEIQALASAVRRVIQARAETIADPALRAAYLNNNPAQRAWF